MKALLLLSAVLTTACIGPKANGSYYFKVEEIQSAERYCASHAGLQYIELKLGENPHYLTHCNGNVAAAVSQITCESCKNGDEKHSYLLTANKIESAREACKTRGKMVWIEFKLRNESFVPVCQFG